MSAEQLRAEQHFTENTFRNPQGKFVVKLPFKNDASLCNSYNIKRFLNLERRFQREPQLLTSYKGFIKEYLLLKHMEPVPRNELGNSNKYYLPHHAVFKQTINGPKIRVVFDGSAKTPNNNCLNENLLNGPTIQQDLFSILCRFRIHQHVLSADITKMYRMILVNPSDRDFQRILWRDSITEPIQEFRLNTVRYGTTCAPFLAVRCLYQLAVDSKNNYPIASDIIERDFYMDDLLT